MKFFLLPLGEGIFSNLESVTEINTTFRSLAEDVIFPKESYMIAQSAAVSQSHEMDEVVGPPHPD